MGPPSGPKPGELESGTLAVATWGHLGPPRARWGHHRAPNLESWTAGTWLWPLEATWGHHWGPNLESWTAGTWLWPPVGTKPGELDSKILAVATNVHQAWRAGQQEPGCGHH
ncbi:hypothetical protein DUI87_35038 [Hirundo rustica rustica]|uniref:Uncharacterized protein n=1 Tax=Hirundo rustica rustica TaxID=333673 RepID=A0A3M0IHM3_HIRRU|nr:hypothetical protein DUI87_35038 [Hirundo rustica rustica]